MPTVLSDRDRLLRMDPYPGMDRAESRVLRQYIRRHGEQYSEFRFNVRLGEGVKVADTFDPAVRRSFEAVTKERPDCVAWRPPNVATLIEAKEAWTNTAVWQLKAYADLYRDWDPDAVITLVGVAAWSTPNGKELARRMGIALYLYTFPPEVTAEGAGVAEARADGE